MRWNGNWGLPPEYDAIQDVLNRAFQSIWLTDTPVDEALRIADLEVQDLLD